MASFGAIDLFAGSPPISGTNLFKVDKNPLNQLDAGIQDVIGKQAQSTAGQIQQLVQELLNSILGLPLTGGFNGLPNDIYAFFEDVLGMLGLVPGLGSGQPGGIGFDIVKAIENFITNPQGLWQSGLLAPLVTDATQGLGLKGFVPLENLALDLIEGIIGGTQSLIDAILAWLGFAPGSGAEADVNAMFQDLGKFFANFNFGLPGFDPVVAIENFVTQNLMPTNLLTSYDLWLTRWRSGINLVLDPSFESQNAVVWPGKVGVMSTAQAHSGTHSLMCTATGIEQDMHLLHSNIGPQTLVVTPGMAFTMSAWVYPTATGGHLKLQMVVSELTGANPPSTAVATEVTVPAVNTWTQMTGNVTVPSTYLFDTADFQWVLEADVPSGNVIYVDDVSVTDYTQAQSLQDQINNIISGVTGDVQQVWDAILASVGVATGVGTQAQTEQYFKDFLSMFANPGLGLSGAGFNAVAAVSNFITNMIKPLNMLAPLVSGLVPTGNIPNLPISQITSLPGYLTHLGTTGLLDAVSSVTGLPSYLTNLSPSGILALAGLAPGALPSTVTAAISNVTGLASYLTHLSPTTGILDAITSVTGLSGFLTNLNSSGILSLSGLASGALPAGVTAAISNVTGLANYLTHLSPTTGLLDAISSVTGLGGYLSNLNTAGVYGGALPISQITSLGGYLTNLSSAGILSLTGLASGALPAGVTAAISNVTGLANYLTHLSPTTGVLDAISSVTGLSSYLTYLSPAGIFSLTGLGSGTLPGGIQVPGGNISSAIAAAMVPVLDASKITTGVFSVPLIPPLDASQITSGTLGQFLMPVIPIGSIGQTTPNLLANPTYATAASIASNPDFTWDSTTTHTADGTGSAKCVCNGAAHNLLSDPATPVAAGHTMTLSHWLMWSGVTGSGACFQLSVVAYLAGGVVSSTVLQTLSNPAASGAWQQLSGSYTCPASGVDSIRLELQVLTGATAGTTWWDDGSITKTQLLNQNWVSGLTSALSTLTNGVAAAALQSDLMNLVNNLGLGSFSSVSNALSSISSRLNYLTVGGTFNAAQLTNLVNIPSGVNAAAITAGILPIGQVPTSQLGIGNIADIQTLSNYITSALIGKTGLSGQVLAQANGSMQSIYSNMVANTTAIQSINSVNIGQANSGVSVSIDFGATGITDLPSAGFTVTYTGAGTSLLGIDSNGNAGWTTQNNDGNRTGFVIYGKTGSPQPTNTDYQLVRGAMNSAPDGATSGGQPYMYALGRVDSFSNPKYYSFGRAYCSGFLSYKADVGYCLNGVETIWASGIPLTWSTNMSVVFGANGNPRQTQVFSGTQLVWQGVEPGSNSMIGTAYRYWGAKNTCTTGGGGGMGTGGTIASTAVSDNAPPTVVGSTFRACRLSTSNVNFPSGSGVIPANFYDTLSYNSPDWSWNPASNVLTLSASTGVAGTYTVKMGTLINNVPTAQKFSLYLMHNGNWADIVASAFADGFNGNSPQACLGATNVYLNPGDTLQFYYWDTSTCSMTGDASGIGSDISVALANRSLA